MKAIERRMNTQPQNNDKESVDMVLEAQRQIHDLQSNKHTETTNDGETESEQSEACDAEYFEEERWVGWYDD